jgi:uncharacterized membrane protein YgaE (UPF0421/DUF939 family)
MHGRATRASRRITALQLSFRAATAAGLAVGIAQWLKLPFPVYALIAAVLVMDLSPSRTLQVATQRMAGTVIGVTVGAVLSYWLPAGPVAIGVSVLLAMLSSHAANLPGGTRLSGYAAGIAVMSYGASPWTYAVHRGIETFIGVAMAVLVSIVPKLLRVDVENETDA